MLLHIDAISDFFIVSRLKMLRIFPLEGEECQQWPRYFSHIPISLHHTTVGHRARLSHGYAPEAHTHLFIFERPTLRII